MRLLPGTRRPFVTVNYGGSCRIAWTQEFPNESPNPPKWLNLAALDSDVAEALGIYGLATDSVKERSRNLFDVLEIVRADAGGTILLDRKQWVDTSELNRCWGTLNAARHARLKDPPPPKPMRLSDSETLIRRLLQRWIEEKLSTVDPVADRD